MKNMKIFTKLAIGFGILLVSLAVVSLLVFVNLRTIDNMVTEIDDLVKEVDERITEMDELLTIVDDNISMVDDNITIVDDLITQVNDKLSDVVNQIDDAALRALVQEIDDMTTVIDDMTSFIDDVTSEIDDLTTAINDMATEIDDMTSVIDARTTELDNVTTNTTAMIMTIAIVIIILGVLVALYITRSITVPLNRVINVLGDVSEGRLNVNIDKNSITKEETGMLIASALKVIDVINTMVDDLIKLEHEYNKVGDIEYRVNTDKYKNTFKEMMEGVNKLPEAAVGETMVILDSLNNINNGNFDFDVKEFPGKKIVMTESINTSLNNLKAVSNEINSMIDAASVKGDLSFQIDDSLYEGGWRKIMTGLNDIAKAVDAPLTEVNVAMNRLAQGEFDTTVDGNYAGGFKSIQDAVNTTVSTLEGYVKEISSILSMLSKGDLTVSINRDYVGNFSAIKESINNISTSLNKTMSEIASASDQVLSGSKQISTSAMDLANGAQEQASSVEELNASVDLLNQQTRQNAENASNANDLSKTSTVNAQEGNESMHQMLDAMMQIRDSSGNISKIIKTIQDIAFQTNLLSLNAAVEAARAGEHGKGFSVVAEEVRSLAGRSQEATVETTGLIENSIEKVESGSSIAESTSTSLNTIVENFKELSVIIDSISSASEEQAEAISQVSTGLGQISQVVQSNSAVSEETAAASEELNSQAEVLQQLVGFFRLK